MILKYYCDGWNYIDKMKNVKWINININVSGILRNSKQNEKEFRLRVTDSDNNIEARSLNKDGEWEPELPDIALFNLIYGEIHHILTSKGENLNIINTEFSKTDMINIIKLSRREKISPQYGRHPEYTRLLCYERDGFQRKAICFLGEAFLCNDQGETIDKIG